MNTQFGWQLIYKYGGVTGHMCNGGGKISRGLNFNKVLSRTPKRNVIPLRQPTYYRYFPNKNRFSQGWTGVDPVQLYHPNF